MSHKPYLKIEIPERICELEGCNIKYKPYRENQKFCSPKHRIEHYTTTHSWQPICKSNHFTPTGKNQVDDEGQLSSI